MPLHMPQPPALYDHPLAASGGPLPSASMPPIPPAAGGSAVALPALRPQAVAGVGLLTAGCTGRPTAMPKCRRHQHQGRRSCRSRGRKKTRI